MKTLALILILLFSAKMAQATPQCEAFAASDAGLALKDASFQLHLGSARSRENTAAMDCMFILQPSLCITGDVEKASLYIAAIAARSTDATVNSLKVNNLNSNRIVMEVTETHLVPNQKQEVVMVGDEHGTNPELEYPAREVCSEDSCYQTREPITTTESHRYMIPQCGYVPAPYQY